MPAKCMTVCWQSKTAPKELRPTLRTLAEDYPIVEGQRRGAIQLAFTAGVGDGSLNVALDDNVATITYDRPHHAMRAVGAVLAGLVTKSKPYTEETPFETLGIMLDCSRNAVMTVEHFKLWLRRLTLLGYNMAMLYTEDTYEIKGEECFGFLRGRYTQKELREIDTYAAKLGVEMIGCIQTLGHLGQMLQWKAYEHLQDNDEVLLVDEPDTYELVDKMIATVASCFRSKRIHVGMDETHGLGQHGYLRRYGPNDPFDLFNRHLGHVVKTCKKYKLQPMIWSDMYFRIASGGGYYVPDCKIPKKVADAIPDDAQLVYWDYYNKDEDLYVKMIRKHRRLSGDPIMAGGVWTWARFWYDPAFTESATSACISACRKLDVKELFFTMWGDDGGYCEFDSALAGLAYGAELAYAGEKFPADRLKKRFAALVGADYQAVLDVSEVNLGRSAAPILWDDLLLGMLWKDRRQDNPEAWSVMAKSIRKISTKIGKYAGIRKPIDFAFANDLLNYLQTKVDLKIALEGAYQKRKMVALKAVRQQARQALKLLDALMKSFRRQWLARNKPFGLETMQIRLGGQRERLRELIARLGDLVAGKIDHIAELDEAWKEVKVYDKRYRSLAAPSRIL